MTKNKRPKTNETKAIRDGFGEGLLEVGKANSRVVALSADLTESVRMQDFAQSFPERFFQVGIAEQNMAGVAAGLALEGYIPYIGSFASFQPYRNLDQIRTSICIQEANVKIISSHAGFSYAADGVQIQALEDVGIMRCLPNMQVWVPADAQQAREMAISAAQVVGPVYIRLGRSATPNLDSIAQQDLVWQPGKAQQLIWGTDATVVSYGYMVAESAQAIRQLKEVGMHVGLINLPCIKPLDLEPILENVSISGKLLVVEEHQKAGGVGELLVRELLAAGRHFRFSHIAVEDKFGDTASSTQDLWEQHGLTAANILTQLRKLVD